MERIFKLLIVLLTLVVNINLFSQEKPKDIDIFDESFVLLEPEKGVGINSVQKLIEILPDDVQKLMNKVNQYSNYISGTESPEQVQKRVLKGAVYYFDMINKDFDISSIKPAQKDDIILDLVLLYFSLAINRNQPFKNGLFLIQDPESVLYNFLVSFPKSKIQQLKGFKHFKSYLEEEIGDQKPNQFKIKVKTLPNSEEITFGRVNIDEINYTFIAPVQSGKSWFSLITGTADTLKSKLGENIQYYTGADIFDKVKDRMDEIPKAILNEYSYIVDELYKLGVLYDEHFKRSFIADALNYGIKGIYNNLRTLAKRASYSDNPKAKNLVPKIGEFLQTLESKYDNLDVRFGEEVVIGSFEFKELFNKSVIEDIRDLFKL